MAGIGICFGAPAGLTGGVLLLCVAAGLYLWRKKAPLRFMAIPIFFALGWLSLLPWTNQTFPEDHIHSHLDGDPVTVTGQIVLRPEHPGNRTRFYLDVQSLESSGSKHEAQGRIRVTVRPPMADLCPGAKVRFSSKLSSFRNFANPGGFDYVRFMRFRGVLGSAYLRGTGKLEVLDPGNSWLFGARESLRSLVLGASMGDAQDVLLALLLGEKEHMSQALRDRFARAGIAHLLAISGLHMGMVALFCFVLFRRVLSHSTPLLLSGRLFAVCAFLSLFPVLFYGAVTGWSPSTQRAVIMVSVFLIGYMVEKDYDSLNTLAVAAMVILLIRPPALFDVSFQLSFVAVFSILYGLKKLSFQTIPITWQEKALRRATIYALIPVLASLGTLPVVLYYFDQVSLVGPLANMLLVPVAGFLVLPLCLGAAFILPVAPLLSHGMMLGAGYLVKGVVHVAGLFANLPYAGIMPLKPNLGEVLLYYTALFCVVHFRTRVCRWLLVACLMAGLGDAAWWMHQRFGDQGLKVTALDVGQGGASLVEFPRGKIMLVDGGGLSAGSTFDTGRMIIAPYLWRRKIHTVDYVVLTHPQQDHAGGLGFIAERFHVKAFWSNGQPATIDSYGRLMEAIEKGEVESPSLESLFSPRTIGGVTARVLHPAPGFQEPSGMEPRLNENSLVLQLRFGKVGFLFTGDIQEMGELQLVKRWPSETLHSTVCMAPHHGSRTSSSSPFVNAVGPRYVVFSTGARNWYGFPDEEVVQRYREAGAQTYDTGNHGAVAIRTNGNAVNMKPFLTPRQ